MFDSLQLNLQKSKLPQIDTEGSVWPFHRAQHDLHQTYSYLAQEASYFTPARYCTNRVLVLSYPIAATYMCRLIALRLRLCVYKPVEISYRN